MQDFKSYACINTDGQFLIQASKKNYTNVHGARIRFRGKLITLFQIHYINIIFIYDSSNVPTLHVLAKYIILASTGHMS
jgi:hypothetical protein